MNIKPSIRWISDLCDIEVRNEALLHRALTHDSVTKKAGGGNANHSNERLEFLGDRVLGLVIAEYLIKLYPNEKEGALARRLAHLASKEMLYETAKSIGLDAHILLSYGEEKSGGRDNAAILSDALEALIAFLYLEYGLELCRSFITKHWEPSFKSNKPPKDEKSALQEWAQKNGFALPEYQVMKQTGPEHLPKFELSVTVGKHTASATAASKKKAEQRAAKLLLEKVKKI